MLNWFKPNKKSQPDDAVVRNLQPREKHQWQLISRTYAPPVRNFEGLELDKLPISVVQKLALGVTTYLWECALTEDIRKEEVLGSDLDLLQEVLQKANLYGRQFIKDESGNQYIVDRYIDPNEIVSLPVRKL